MHLKRATTTGTPKGSPNHSKANDWVATQTASPEQEQSPNHSLVNDWVGTQNLTVNYWVAIFILLGIPKNANIENVKNSNPLSTSCPIAVKKTQKTDPTQSFTGE